MFSQTVEYALRAILYLASLDGGAANCRTIAGHTRVPTGYLAKVMRDLVVARLVASFRGPHGGFALARTPEDITILDVVSAVEPIQRFQKYDTAAPFRAELGSLHRRLDDALADLERTFRSTTLAQVLKPDATN